MQTQVQTTLLDLVHTCSSFIDDDREVVALVTALVNSGRVRLCGTFAGATIDLSPSCPTTLAPSSFEDSPGVTRDESMTPATPLPP